MRAASDPYLRERLHDLDDLSRRLLRMLRGEDLSHRLPDNAIVLAETLGPAELLELDRHKLAGLVLGEASSNSHAAIVARSLRVPMVGGLYDIIDRAEEGDEILLDGSTGDTFLRPTSEAIETFEEKARVRSEELERFARSKDEPARTRDGVLVSIEMNAGLPMDIPMIAEVGASGVGLFRTELQFLVGHTLPSATEQTKTYKEVFDAANGARIVFRTADLGSDKRAGYMHGPVEANPAMGWRGLRLAIDREGLLRIQIRALINAANGRPLSVLLPLVTEAREFARARAIIDKEFERCQKIGEAMPETFELGAMVEIPAAAWGVREVAEQADFLSVGGNDLAQFFFAADRESEMVSARYDYLSVPFVSFLRHIVREAEAVDTPVGYCGEQATDPLMALVLVALGFERISVPASSVLPLKEMIRGVDRGALTERIDRLLAEPRGEQSLRERVRDLANELKIPVLKVL
jgi:phosphotransferase system enzyme I (PtsP)